MYVLRVVILDTKRCGEREHERKREAIPMASRRYQQKKKKNKTEISGCGSFVVPYFQPATSINHLQNCDKYISFAYCFFMIIKYE